MPEGLTRIEPMTFSGCIYLYKAKIPSSVQKIDDTAFDDSDQYVTCTVEPNSFAELYCKENEINYVYDDGTGLIEHGSLGDRVEWSFGWDGTVRIFGSGDIREFDDFEETGRPGAFLSCHRVEIEDGITNIPDGMFDSFWSWRLTEVKLGNTIKSIGKYAFRGCGSLTKLVIPASVETIGEGAFDDIPQLELVFENQEQAIKFGYE